MTVIPFACFIIVAHHAGPVSKSIVKAIFQTVRFCWCLLRKLPQNHLANRTVGVNIFFMVD